MPSPFYTASGHSNAFFDFVFILCKVVFIFILKKESYCVSISKLPFIFFQHVKEEIPLPSESLIADKKSVVSDTLLLIHEGNASFFSPVCF